MAFHAFLTTLFLLSGQWTALILNVPLVAFNVNKCVIAATRHTICLLTRLICPLFLFSAYRVIGKNHMYDATEIFRTLGTHKKECFIKLGFYLVSFFFYLYRYVHCTFLLLLRDRVDCMILSTDLC